MPDLFKHSGPHHLHTRGTASHTIKLAWVCSLMHALLNVCTFLLSTLAESNALAHQHLSILPWNLLGGGLELQGVCGCVWGARERVGGWVQGGTKGEVWPRVRGTLDGWVSQSSASTRNSLRACAAAWLAVRAPTCERECEVWLSFRSSSTGWPQTTKPSLS